jgi:hypothetical protein
LRYATGTLQNALKFQTRRGQRKNALKRQGISVTAKAAKWERNVKLSSKNRKEKMITSSSSMHDEKGCMDEGCSLRSRPISLRDKDMNRWH